MSLGTEWECVRCTYLNKQSSKKCEICLTDKPVNIIVNEYDTTLIWECLSCHYSKNTKNTCKLCGKSKRHSDKKRKKLLHKKIQKKPMKRSSSYQPSSSMSPNKSNHNDNEISLNNNISYDNGYFNDFTMNNGNNIYYNNNNNMGYINDNNNINNEGIYMNEFDRDSYWVCSVCTFKNQPELVKCQLCEGKREITTTIGYEYEEKMNKPMYNNGMNNDDNKGNNNINDGNYVFNNYYYSNSDDNNDDLNDHNINILNPTIDNFISILNIIVKQAPSNKNAVTVLKSLRKITSRVSDDKPKYRILDTRSDGVQTKLRIYIAIYHIIIIYYIFIVFHRLLGFEGSLEFLQLLGYVLDDSKTKLQCIKHPPQNILNELVNEIDKYLLMERDKISKLKHSNHNHSINPNNYNGNGHHNGHHKHLNKKSSIEIKNSRSEIEHDNGLLMDDDDDDILPDVTTGEFTLTQLVGLITHETLQENEAIKVLLLCHRCFSDSLELIDALRKRFFVPGIYPSIFDFIISYYILRIIIISAPNNAHLWDETKIESWCNNVQRPIQKKCIQILTEWITNYYEMDFITQPTVLKDLKLFGKQILECKYESDDGWYDDLAARLESVIYSGEHRLKLLNSINLIGSDVDADDDDKNENELLSSIQNNNNNGNNKPKPKAKKKKKKKKSKSQKGILYHVFIFICVYIYHLNVLIY